MNPQAMRTITREIRPINIDPNQWQQQTGSDPCHIEESGIDYQAEVLTSGRGTAHSLEFEFKTSPLREAAFDLALCVSADALVKLYLNNRLICTSAVAALKDKRPSLHHLRLNITKWTEASASSRLRLNTFYQGQQGVTTILLYQEQPEWRLEVRQEWSWRYALQSLFFFIFAWGAILGSSVYLVAQVRALGETWRFYAVFVTVLV